MAKGWQRGEDRFVVRSKWAPAFQAPAPEICAETIQRILCSHDRPIIEATARAKLERVLRYYDEGHVNLLIVAIIESADNENAVVAPVIRPCIPS